MFGVRWVVWLVLGLVTVLTFASPLMAQTPPPEPEPEDDGGMFDWASRIMDQILCALKRFVCWLVNALYDIFAPALQSVLERIPDAVLGLAGELAAAIAIANHWLPLTEIFAMAVTYYTFLAGFVVVKLLLKLVPTVG